MSCNWRIVKAKDIINFNPQESLLRNIITKKVAMDKIQPFTKFFHDYELAPFGGGAKFRNGDTLMARITPCLENGKTAQVTILEKNEVGFGSTEFIVLREIPNISDRDYIYYLSISSIFRDKAIKSMVGSSGRQRVQENVLENIEFFAPDLIGQKTIAATLSCLDDKIELNNRINKTLEEMAQAIYKSWFVDFEPFQDGEFVDSELGVIPKGWRVGTIGDISEICIGGDWGEDKFKEGLIPVVCLRGTDLQALKEVGFSNKAPIRWIKKDSLNKRAISETDILIGGSGLGPIGRSLYFTSTINELFEYPLIYSNFCKKIKCGNSVMAIFLESALEKIYV